MRSKVLHEHVQQLRGAMQVLLGNGAGWRRVEQRRLVVVAKHVLSERSAGAAAHRSRRQVLWQNHARSEAYAVKSVIAFADPAKAVAWGHHPRVVNGPLQISPKIFEDCRVLWPGDCKVVESLIDASSQACCRNIVPNNAAMNDLGVERGLRNQFAQQMWNVRLAFRPKRLSIACTAAEGDDHRLGCRACAQAGRRGCSEDSACRRGAGDVPQKFAPRLRLLPRNRVEAA